MKNLVILMLGFLMLILSAEVLAVTSQSNLLVPKIPLNRLDGIQHVQTKDLQTVRSNTAKRAHNDVLVRKLMGMFFDHKLDAEELYQTLRTFTPSP